MVAEAQVAGLMSIGRFARRTGLSVGALRHYAALGLLVPARVDPATGYRYYHPDQVEPARLVAALRDLEVPLTVIRELLGGPPPEQRRRLTAHTRRWRPRSGGCSDVPTDYATLWKTRRT